MLILESSITTTFAKRFFCKEYIMGKLFFKKHGACFSKAGMELECFRENMRGLAVAVERTCSFKVIHQLVAESRVSDIVNDNLRSFFRGKTFFPRRQSDLVSAVLF
mgnify:CR=1 FL=1